MAKKSSSAKKKKVRVEPIGQAHIHSSFNNIIVTLANANGDVISWSSSGKNKFRGSKKNTPYAAQLSAADCAKEAYDLGLRKVRVFVKGPGSGRESAIRTLHNGKVYRPHLANCTAVRRAHIWPRSGTRKEVLPPGSPREE